MAGIVTVDLDAIAPSGLTTAAFVAVHELGHGYARSFLGHTVGSTEVIARMTFENAVRRCASASAQNDGPCLSAL